MRSRLSLRPKGSSGLVVGLSCLPSYVQNDYYCVVCSTQVPDGFLQTVQTWANAGIILLKN